MEPVIKKPAIRENFCVEVMASAMLGRYPAGLARPDCKKL
jgi:hypothetical protein